MVSTKLVNIRAVIINKYGSMDQYNYYTSVIYSINLLTCDVLANNNYNIFTCCNRYCNVINRMGVSSIIINTFYCCPNHFRGKVANV